MKKKAMVVVLLCVLGIAAFSVSNAGAAATPPWYNCTVSVVGSLSTLYFLQAADVGGAFGPTYFLIDAVNNPQAKAYLAAALTGYASGGFVSLYLPSGFAPNTIVQAVMAGQQ